MENTIIWIIVSIAFLVFIVFLGKAIIMWFFDIEKTQKLIQEQNYILREIADSLRKNHLNP
jgi:sensor domain CHASE-containing protein